MRGFTTLCFLGLIVIGLCLAQAPVALAAAPESQPLLIRMEVPANAAVWFDGAPTTQTGRVREFLSQPIAPDKNYTYQVRIHWMQDGQAVEQDRSIRVRGGQQVNIDVTQQNVSVSRTAYYPPVANPTASTPRYVSSSSRSSYSSRSYSDPFSSGPRQPFWVPHDWSDYARWNTVGNE